MRLGGQGRMRRAGFTLVEMIVAMSLFGIVGALTVVAVLRHRRFAEATAATLELRARLREAAAILSADLRYVSPRAGDLVSVGDSAIMLRTSAGVAVVCAVRDEGRTLDVVPDAARRGARLTAWVGAPGAGQRIVVYDDSLREWSEHRLEADIRRSARRCPPPFGTAGDPAAFTLRVAPAVRMRSPGAQLRFQRLSLYALYRSADRDWYLGYASALGSVRELPSLQPVSGPYLPYRSGGRGGMSIACHDTLGADIPRTVCAGARSVGGIAILMRARTRPIVRTAGGVRQAVIDSVRIILPFPDE